MQDANTDINILKSIFDKFYEELDTDNNRKWFMDKIGYKNNIELLEHVEQYYNIVDEDIYYILYGTTNKHNYYCLNTIKYIFENYNFDYDINVMFDIIRELYYMEFDEAIYYIISQLVKKCGVNYIDNLLNHHNMNNFLYNSFLKYFITFCLSNNVV
jgi:hypothetical protein